MASIRKRGENSYLLVVSRGYDYQGNRLKPAQKTVHPPLGLTAKQTQKWLNEPNRALSWKVPADLMASETGAYEVIKLITRLEHGVYS